ncbi:hypothetical protein ACP70R_009461 [Stipagrostis hirtigluma subsp. patula]
MAPSVLLLLLVTTFAVYVPGDSATASSCDQAQLVGAITQRCHGAKAIFEARDKCCHELGKHSECACLVLTEVFGAVEQLPRLCDNHNACSAIWKNETYCHGPSLLKCKLLNPVVSDFTACSCRKVVEELPKLHDGCLHDLVGLKVKSDICFGKALAELGIEKYADVIEKLCHHRH